VVTCRVKRVAITVCVIACLLASTVTACACSHHSHAKPESSTPACHQHAEKAKNGEAETSLAGCDCRCFDDRSDLSLKSEGIKLKNQPALAVLVTPEPAVSVADVVVNSDSYSKPRFLSDSFYNLPPGRAPPGA